MRRLCIAVLLHASTAAAQMADLGHRFPGAAGVDAGSQPDQGLYVADRVVWFASDRVNDRAGRAVPIAGLDIDAIANAIGVAGTLKRGDLYISAAIAAPVVKLSANADQPEASVDRLGLGNVYVEPLKLGTRWDHVDAVAGYAFYVPTAQGARTGVGRPQWSHQVSAGGTVFFDERRRWRISALGSYVFNGKKLDIDITRGSTLQIQGGLAGRVLDVVDLGVAGYALWQVTDDRGSALPPQLAGARDRVFGIGPEVGLLVPRWRTRFLARFEWDLHGDARPVGTLLVVGASVALIRD